MVRQQVISLYRDVFRALRAMPDDAQKKEVKAWAKEEFRRNRHHTDEVTIAWVVGNVRVPFLLSLLKILPYEQSLPANVVHAESSKKIQGLLL